MRSFIENISRSIKEKGMYIGGCVIVDDLVMRIINFNKRHLKIVTNDIFFRYGDSEETSITIYDDEYDLIREAMEVSKERAKDNLINKILNE